MVTLNSALETVMELPFDERSELIDLVRRRQNDEWRNEILEVYKQAKENIKNGILIPKDADEVISELHSYLNSEN